MRRKIDILVVDDEKNVRWVLKMIIEELGHNFIGAEHPIEAKEILEEKFPDLIVSDIKMPYMDGIEFLKYVKTNYPDLPVVMLSGHGTISLALEAVKVGALDFLEKDLPDEKIKERLSQFIEKVIISTNSSLNSEYIFKDKLMVRKIKEAENIAKKDISILLTGENGVGKEAFAKVIFKASGRKKMISLNCATIPPSLFESEIFGYEKGAFTGADKLKKGKIEDANNGILFLDEIGELTPENQAAFLRVLQEKSFYRLGGKKLINADFKLISATNRDLKLLVSKKMFREDLFYRINGYEIEIPPLRKRRDDILPLAYFFIKKYAKKYGIEEKELHDDLKNFLIGYHWPGNVRELQNLIERLLILTEGPYLYFDEKFITEKVDMKKYIEKSEKEMLLRIYKMTNGDWEKMSALFSDDIENIKKRMEKYEII